MGKILLIKEAEPSSQLPLFLQWRPCLTSMPQEYVLLCHGWETQLDQHASGVCDPVSWMLWVNCLLSRSHYRRTFLILSYS